MTFRCFSVWIFIVTKRCLSLFDLSEIARTQKHARFNWWEDRWRTQQVGRGQRHTNMRTYTPVCMYLSLNPRSWRTPQINLHLYCPCCCARVFDLPPTIVFQSVALVKHTALSMVTWPRSFFEPSGNGRVSFATSLKKKKKRLSPVILHMRRDQHVSASLRFGLSFAVTHSTFDWPRELLVSVVRAFERRCRRGHLMVFKCYLFWAQWVNERFKTHMTLLYTPTQSLTLTHTLHSHFFPFSLSFPGASRED